MIELLNATDKGQTKRFVSRLAPRASLLIALALLGCGADAAETGTETAPTAPSTSTGTAGSVAPATPVGSTATTPSTTTTTPTNTGTTTAPSTSSGSMTPPSSQASTTPPTGQATTPPTTTTPPATGTPGAAGAAGAPATPMAGGDLPVEMGTPTLFWLEITSNAVYTAGADGSGQKRFASGSPLSAPDGIAVDPKGGFVYVLNMGTVIGGGNAGSMVR
ncbi:MAG TPA: hypothetical protein VMF89_12855, partial [Polyangiales bacterium]|nr:hypothetical protein [Polyangiales bacterium]